MADKIIPLGQTYEVFGKTFKVLTLREPTGADYWAVGPIADWQPVGEAVALIGYNDKIKEYAERLIKPIDGGDAVAMLGVLNLADTLKVEAAVKGFFTEANKSNAPPTS